MVRITSPCPPIVSRSLRARLERLTCTDINSAPSAVGTAISAVSAPFADTSFNLPLNLAGMTTDGRLRIDPRLPAGRYNLK